MQPRHTHLEHAGKHSRCAGRTKGAGGAELWTSDLLQLITDLPLKNSTTVTMLPSGKNLPIMHFVGKLGTDLDTGMTFHTFRGLEEEDKTRKLLTKMWRAVDGTRTSAHTPEGVSASGGELWEFRDRRLLTLTHTRHLLQPYVSHKHTPTLSHKHTHTQMPIHTHAHSHLPKHIGDGI